MEIKLLNKLYTFPYMCNYVVCEIATACIMVWLKMCVIDLNPGLGVLRSMQQKQAIKRGMLMNDIYLLLMNDIYLLLRTLYAIQLYLT